MNAKEFFDDWSEVIDFTILEEALSKLKVKMGKYPICPTPQKLFEAFRYCPYEKLSTVILGQSPYPQRDVATGLAFGNKEGTRFEDFSPSLKVIYQCIAECYNDLPFSTIDDVFPTLEPWAVQGVLLLNSTLSIREGEPDSHYDIWRPFIKSLIENLVNKKKNVIFVLLGNVANTFKNYIPKERRITSVHPAFCARNNMPLPDIFQDIDKKHLENGTPLIYWI